MAMASADEYSKTPEVSSVHQQLLHLPLKPLISPVEFDPQRSPLQLPRLPKFEGDLLLESLTAPNLVDSCFSNSATENPSRCFRDVNKTLVDDEIDLIDLKTPITSEVVKNGENGHFFNQIRYLSFQVQQRLLLLPVLKSQIL